MSAVDFSKLNKLTAKSYNEQKALIKKVLQGRVIKCPTCQQTLMLVLPEENKKAGVFCPKGCTDIELDMK